MRKVLALTLLLHHLDIPPAFAASQVYKCTTTQGAITFTDNACPGDAEQSVQALQQPMLIKALPRHLIERTQGKSSTAQRTTRVTVVGEQAHPCGTYDVQARRTAMVRKQVKSGMSQTDVESMFGKPLKQDISNGVLTATYRSGKGQKRSVRFDEHGCVRLSQKSAAAKSSSKKTATKKIRAKKNLQ